MQVIMIIQVMIIIIIVSILIDIRVCRPLSQALVAESGTLLAGGKPTAPAQAPSYNKIRMCICVYIYIYILYTYMCICVYIYIYIYI